MAKRLLADGAQLKPAYTTIGGAVPDQCQLHLPGHRADRTSLATGSTSSSSSTLSARRCCCSRPRAPRPPRRRRVPGRWSGDCRDRAALPSQRTLATLPRRITRGRGAAVAGDPRGDPRLRPTLEGAFRLCGFLMALAYSQQGDRITAARWFERNRSACGPPGLCSEECDVAQRHLRCRAVRRRRRRPQAGSRTVSSSTAASAVGS